MSSSSITRSGSAAVAGEGEQVLAAPAGEDPLDSDPALPPEPGPAASGRLAALAEAVRSAGLKLGLSWTMERCLPAALDALSRPCAGDPGVAALMSAARSRG